MKDFVYNYVKSCSPCRKRVSSTLASSQSGLQAPISGLFYTISLDFTGLLPKTERGNLYELVGIEHLTWWPHKKALPTCLSTDVIDLLHSSFMSRATVPRVILSNNGSQSTALSTQEYGKEWRVE